MNLKLLTAGLLLGLAIPVVAIARQDPTPPPSGVVVHLFGQNSVMSNVLPTAPQGSLSGSAAATAPAGTGDNGSLTLGDIAHQMFVVGDPNNPPRPASGRASELPGR